MFFFMPAGILPASPDCGETMLKLPWKNIWKPFRNKKGEKR